MAYRMNLENLSKVRGRFVLPVCHSTYSFLDVRRLLSFRMYLMICSTKMGMESVI
jgi:hypothetical protein